METKFSQPAKEQSIFNALLKAAPDATVIIDAHGVIQFVNSQTEVLFGYNKNELPGKAIEILVPSAFHQIHIKHTVGYRKDPIVRSMGADPGREAIKKDGTKFPVEISLSSLQTDGGVLILVSIRNIAELRKIKDKLISSELRYRRLFETAQDGIFILDANTGKIEDVNPFLMKILGYKHPEFLGKQLWEIGFFKDIAANKACFLKLQKERYVRYENLPLQTKAGNPIWVEFVSNIYDVSGKPVIQCNIRDITIRKNAEEKLKVKEFFLRESQRAGNIGSYRTNFITGNWQSSETLDNIFGIDKNYDRNIEGWLNIVHPGDKQEMDEYLRLEVLGKRKSFNKEYRIIRNSDKQIRWVCGMGDLKLDVNGDITEMIGTIQDITDRKNSEESLFNSQQNYKNLLKDMNDGFIVDDISGKVTFVNKKFLEIFGLEEGDVNDLVIEDYVAPDYAELLRDRHNHRITGEKMPDVFVFEGVRKDGKRIWLEVRVNQIIKDGIITGTQSVISDITERKKAEDALRESEETFHRLFNESADPVFLYDDTGFTDCNSSAVSILGYSSRQEILNKKAWDISPEKQPDGMLSAEKAEVMIAQALQQGYNKFEWVHTKSDGTEFPVEVMLTAITLKGKQSFYSIWRDITERKKAEEDLRRSEIRLNEAQAIAHISNWEVDMVQNIHTWSDEFYRIYGLNKSEVKPSANLLLSYIHPDDAQNAQKKMREAFEIFCDSSFNFRFIRKDGITRYGYTEWRYEFDKNGNPVRLFGIMQDITERKAAEVEITKSHERYEFVNKATRDTIWEWDYHTQKGIWGKGFMTTFGYSEDKLKYGESWLDEYVHPDDKEKILKNIQNRIENGLQNCQNEYRFRCADGSYKYVFDRGFILYDENKKPYRMIGAMTDVTETKRLERELAEQQIKQQKLITETIIHTQEKERNELGRELHDNINQILATVKMYLGMAKAKENISVDLVGQSYEYVNEAMEEIRKLSHLLVTPSLGDFGLKEALQGLVNDVNLINTLHVQLLFDEKYNEKDIDKYKELMIYRIVQEQINNITKYAKAGNAVITLKTDNEKLVLSVVDDGVGFDVTQKSKGIGLKNINSRVEFYSGNMKIISSPGNGCTLEIIIPH
jgi:two-component system sensor histidine kinase UhpB